MKILINEIVQSQKTNIWSTGNDVLYNMCEKYPYHVDKGEIVSKIWLIGRSYAAAIERRRANNHLTNDEFYVNVVGENLVNNGKIIDGLLTKLKPYTKITDKNIDLILEIHSLLTNLFQDITGLSKRSLASKYLHFHLPKLFYIYDSRAVKALNNYKKELANDYKGIVARYHNRKYDKDYTRFLIMMHLLNHAIDEKFSIWLTPRELDNYLLSASK